MDQAGGRSPGADFNSPGCRSPDCCPANDPDRDRNPRQLLTANRLQLPRSPDTTDHRAREVSLTGAKLEQVCGDPEDLFDDASGRATGPGASDRGSLQIALPHLLLDIETSGQECHSPAHLADIPSSPLEGPLFTHHALSPVGLTGSHP